MIRTILIITVTIALSFNYCLASDFLRCGSKLVGVGDSKAKVFIICKKPDFTDTTKFSKTIKTNSNKSTTVMVEREIWTYNFGPSRFMQELTFKNGKLTKVKELGYGTAK